MTDTTQAEIARIARVWPAVERLVAEARRGMWNSSATCDAILAGFLDVDPTSPRLHHAIRDVMDAQEITHDGIKVDKAIKPRSRQ